MRQASENEFPEIKELLKLIRETYDPEAVILFGSRARGDASNDSDWNLYVILVGDKDESILSSSLAWKVGKGSGDLADIKAISLSDFLEGLMAANSLASEIQREGVIVQGSLAQLECCILLAEIYRDFEEIGEYVEEGSGIRLTYRTGANQVSAARILKKHGISLKVAHVAITEMIDHGSGELVTENLQNFSELQQQLEEVGVYAEFLTSGKVADASGTQLEEAMKDLASENLFDGECHSTSEIDILGSADKLIKAAQRSTDDE